MKNFALILVGLLIVAAGWIIFFKPDDKPTTPKQTANTQIPVPKTGDLNIAFTDFKFNSGNFSFQYPKDWNKVEGEDNSDESQIVTLESPMDANKFYYCIDFNEYSPAGAAKADFKAKDVDVLEVADHAASGISKPLKLVTYKLPSGRILTTVTDDLSVTTEATEFKQSITNPYGRMVQLFGRYNCREEKPVQFSLNDYKSGEVYNEGLQIFLKLSY